VTRDNHELCTCWWCWRTVYADEHDFRACHVEFLRPQRERAARRRELKEQRAALQAARAADPLPTLFPSTGAE